MADPVVKAVLDNLGRRYLVERLESEDGSQWCERYSDGRMIQGGIWDHGSLTNIASDTITFLAEFQYIPTITGSTVRLNNNDDLRTASCIGKVTTTDFYFTFYATASLGGSRCFNWLAFGYAA